MRFDKSLIEPDNGWKDWAIVVILWLFALGCLSGNALDFQRFKSLRLILSGMSAITTGLGLAKVRQIEVNSPYYSQREIMRNDLFLEIQSRQLPSLQPPPQASPVSVVDAVPLADQLYGWERLLFEAVGIIIAGNSGAGKTSTACYILGLLTQDNPKKIIVCDPHFNKIWKQTGLNSIGRIPDIEQHLKDYVEEMDRRYDQLAEGVEDFEPMIIVVDELGKCQKKFSDPKFIEEAIARLGCEGRKVGMTAIIICHSQNVEDMGISKKLRNNYVLILLGASALDQCELKWKAGNEKRLFVEAQAYPCLVSGSVRDCPALHPTHHQYSEYKIQGNAPMNLLPIKQIHGGDRPISLVKNAPHDSHTPTPHHTVTDLLESCFRLDSTRPHPDPMGDICPHCGSGDNSPHGKTRAGTPRKICNGCGKTFTVN